MPALKRHAKCKPRAPQKTLRPGYHVVGPSGLGIGFSAGIVLPLDRPSVSGQWAVAIGQWVSGQRAVVSGQWVSGQWAAGSGQWAALAGGCPPVTRLC